MNKYICKYGLVHDKKVIDDEPSSNNGYIYSAYAKLLGRSLNMRKIAACYKQCRENTAAYRFSFQRLPAKNKPPISRDELIGAGILGLLPSLELEHYDWYYYKEQGDIPLLRQLKAMISLIGKHRNYVWQEKVYDAYPIVFRVSPADRFYFKKKGGLRTTIFEKLAWYLYMPTTILIGNLSSKNVLWAQLKALDSKIWIRAIDLVKNFRLYFGNDHLLTVLAEHYKND